MSKKGSENMIAFGVRLEPDLLEAARKLAGPIPLGTIIRELVRLWVNGKLRAVWVDGEVKIEIEN